MNGIDSLRMPVITTGRPFSGTAAVKSGTDASFQEILSQRLQQSQPLTFSKHALTRTEQRGIELSQTDMDRLGGAVDKARDKGITDTLVFMNDKAFIVNVPSNVVVTVIDSAESGNTVFTNIDGAVIA